MAHVVGHFRPVDVPDEGVAAGGKALSLQNVRVEGELHGVVLLGSRMVFRAFFARPDLDVAGDVAFTFPAQQVRVAEVA